jgi:transposase
MVRAVRAGQSMRSVAMAFGVSVSTVAYWVEHARGKRIDRVVFASLKPGRAWNRTALEVEERILSIRRVLRDNSVLGEYGTEAIALALQDEPSIEHVPSRATIIEC